MGLWISGAGLVVGVVVALLGLAVGYGSLRQQVRQIREDAKEWMPRELCVKDMSHSEADGKRRSDCIARLEAGQQRIEKQLTELRARLGISAGSS